MIQLHDVVHNKTVNLLNVIFVLSVLWHHSLGNSKGIQPKKM